MLKLLGGGHLVLLAPAANNPCSAARRMGCFLGVNIFACARGMYADCPAWLKKPRRRGLGQCFVCWQREPASRPHPKCRLLGGECIMCCLRVPTYMHQQCPARSLVYAFNCARGMQAVLHHSALFDQQGPIAHSDAQLQACK